MRGRTFELPKEDAGKRIWLKDRVGIADFTLPSSVPRFFLVDMAGGAVHPFLVTHGKGSDPDHTGFLQSFSNVEGSMATSRGAYASYGWYDGSHGPSMRLIGLDADNSNAADRAIVIHGAPYANADMIPRWGKLGRSDGCFVFPEDNLMEMLDEDQPSTRSVSTAVNPRWRSQRTRAMARTTRAPIEPCSLSNA